MGCQWILMSRFTYYMRFLLNLLSFCAIANFNNDLCLITKKVQQQNKYSFRFLFSLVGIWASSLYSYLGFLFFSTTPPPPKKKKKKSIWLLKEIEFKLESQINYIVGKRKQKHLKILQHYQIACMGSLMVILSKFYTVLQTYMVTLDNIICIEN